MSNLRQHPDTYRQMRGGAPKDSATDRLYCDRDPAHPVRMEWVLVNGIRTGAMKPWCYHCQRFVENTVSPPANVDGLERREKGRFAEAVDRNTEIRLLSARKISPSVIAKTYGISRARVRQIVQRIKTPSRSPRRRSA